MNDPQAAREHYRAQQALTVTALAAASSVWLRMTADFDASWPRVLPRLLRLLTAGQLGAARSAPGYVADVLDELGIDAPPSGDLSPEAFTGTAADGRPLDTLLYGAVAHAKRARRAQIVVDGDVTEMTPGVSVPEALDIGERHLRLIVASELADAERVATETVIASRAKLGGYVRMLNPPSCARCVVQAGRFFRWNAGFQRHPGCDCRHIPAREDTADELLTEPRKYFDSLTEAEQDKAFTKAGADAIRQGADISQVVNARRGMSTTVLHRRQATVTTEGTTRRGVFGGSEGAAAGGYTATRVGRRGYIKNQVERRTKRARLMPETILQHAADRDDAIRLLRLYGFITD